MQEGVGSASHQLCSNKVHYEAATPGKPLQDVTAHWSVREARGAGSQLAAPPMIQVSLLLPTAA